MRYLSICSGIEAASVAWEPLGWKPAAFSEIDPFPRAVLAHHYPDVPLHGDFTTIGADTYGSVDLLVGGTPCQSFSVAGLRGGLDDDRGNLALEFARLAWRVQPRWIVWENVPGVLSSNGGRDFGSILGALAELGYGLAYRVLDAQHFGVPQRRRRVFVVGCLGDWRRAAAVLFERHSLQGNPPPRREARQTAPTIPSRRSAGGGLGTDFDCDGGLISQCVTTGTGRRYDLRGEGFDASEDGTGRGTPLVPVAFGWQNSASQGLSESTTTVPTLDKSKTPAVAHFQDSEFGCKEYDTAAIRAGRIPEHSMTLRPNSAVRRLTPRECERLQGFPDDYTLIPYRRGTAADGPRYKALGNSMAVPVMRWIGERIVAVESLTSGSQ